MGLGSRFSCVNLGVESFSSDLPETGGIIQCVWSACDETISGQFLLYWDLKLLQVMGAGFKNTCTASGKSNISKAVPRLFGWIYKIVIKL